MTLPRGPSWPITSAVPMSSKDLVSYRGSLGRANLRDLEAEFGHVQPEVRYPVEVDEWWPAGLQTGV
jgi:hypothetical protein